jgi:hypothetical protein
MSSAITTAGQTRINQLRGAELPLIIDRMVLALIPGLDPTLAVDRSQQMPDPGDIVHTATIASDHKGYVDPDQVVYSIILGSDVGDFSFNWIGLVEAVTDTVIAITTTPETPKRKTNLGNNTTGNNITRNFMIAFQDAQNLTGVTVAAETWQFDYQAEFTDHKALVVNPYQDGSTKKHVTDSQAKVWQDHAETPHDFVSPDTLVAWLPKRAFVTNDYIRIPDVPGGLIIQFGQFNTGTITNSATGNVSFPIAFPNACVLVLPGETYGSTAGTGATEGFDIASWTNAYFTWFSAWQYRQDTYGAIKFIAFGY